MGRIDLGMIAVIAGTSLLTSWVVQRYWPRVAARIYSAPASNGSAALDTGTSTFASVAV